MFLKIYLFKGIKKREEGREGDSPYAGSFLKCLMARWNPVAWNSIQSAMWVAGDQVLGDLIV